MDLLKLLFGESNLIISCVFCILSLLGVHGKQPLEVSTNDVLDLSTLGVDVVWCKSMLYQAKVCHDHNMQLLDENGVPIIHFSTGGYWNTMSSLYVFPTNNDIKNWNTPLLLHCDEFRWFWMSWGAGRIQYGAGRVLGENAIFDLENPTGSQVRKMALEKRHNAEVSIKLGETERERYARVLEEGKFSDGMISDENSTSLDNCVDMCSQHDNCGMFSYNQNLGLCAIFDRMTSSFTLTSEEGWKSWKLLYCYP